MDFCVVFWVLGIIFLIIEYWYLTHLYVMEGYHKRPSDEKISFKVLHLVLLVILNAIPIANIVGFILILLIPGVETDIYFKIVPPDEGEDTKISKLDKLLNKKL